MYELVEQSRKQSESSMAMSCHIMDLLQDRMEGSDDDDDDDEGGGDRLEMFHRKDFIPSNEEARSAAAMGCWCCFGDQPCTHLPFFAYEEDLEDDVPAASFMVDDDAMPEPDEVAAEEPVAEEEPAAPPAKKKPRRARKSSSKSTPAAPTEQHDDVVHDADDAQ